MTPILAAAANSSAFLMLLFWIVFVLSLILAWFPTPTSPYDRPARGVLFLLIGILGLAVFGFPLN